MTHYKLALIGFGNAAKALVKLLVEKESDLKARKLSFSITAIATGTRGCIMDPRGLDMATLLTSPTQVPFDQALDTLTLIAKADYDVLLELSPLNIHTGQPAIHHIQAAMTRKKHVITANKGPIAWAFHELETLAQEMGVSFLYETTVMDGTPVFNLVKHTLPMCQVTEIRGILNTTTNFIITALEAGHSYEDVIEEGMVRGFVEADPSLDIEGFDAAAKLTALVNVLMKGHITPHQVDTTGIENLSVEDIHHALNRGFRIKLICHAINEKGQIKATVMPQSIPQNTLFAQIDATSSALTITTDLMGAITVVEHNPEIEQTAYGLFSDLLHLA